MARPYSSLQLSSRAKRVDSQSTRDAIFEPYKGLVEQLYVENRMPLKDLMEHMKLQWGFNQT